MTDSVHRIEILLVEDSPTDRLIAVEALQHAKILNSLNVVENGFDAMAYLRRQGKYSSANRPDLILLDLNLPRSLSDLDRILIKSAFLNHRNTLARNQNASYRILKRSI